MSDGGFGAGSQGADAAAGDTRPSDTSNTDTGFGNVSTNPELGGGYSDPAAHGNSADTGSGNVYSVGGIPSVTNFDSGNTSDGHNAQSFSDSGFGAVSSNPELGGGSSNPLAHGNVEDTGITASSPAELLLGNIVQQASDFIKSSYRAPVVNPYTGQSVNFVSYLTTNPVYDPVQHARFQDIANFAADTYGIPRGLFNALIYKESRWQQFATSPAGALGLGQIIPTQAGADLARQGTPITDYFDPAQSLLGAAKYLRQQYNATGSWGAALQAYNGGLGLYQRNPDNPQTVSYATDILSNWRKSNGDFYTVNNYDTGARTDIAETLPVYESVAGSGATPAPTPVAAAFPVTSSAVKTAKIAGIPGLLKAFGAPANVVSGAETIFAKPAPAQTAAEAADPLGSNVGNASTGPGAGLFTLASAGGGPFNVPKKGTGIQLPNPIPFLKNPGSIPGLPQWLQDLLNFDFTNPASSAPLTKDVTGSPAIMAFLQNNFLLIAGGLVAILFLFVGIKSLIAAPTE